MTAHTAKNSSAPSPHVIHLQVNRTDQNSDGYVITLAPSSTTSVRLSKPQKQLLASVLPEIQRRVRITDPVLAEVERNGKADLGPYPVLPLVKTSLIALYLAILEERDLVAHGQVHWPEIQDNTDLNNLESLCCSGEDFCSAVQDYLRPRVLGKLVSAPYEFLPYSPRGQYLILTAIPFPSRDDSRRNQKPSFHMGCYWCVGHSSHFSAPKAAWQSIEIAEAFLGSFTRPIRDEAREKNVCDLTEVEIFPQVSPFGHAALWLAALRHEKLVTSAKNAWPALFHDDLLYMSTFGNDYTKGLIKKYLAPVQKAELSSSRAMESH